MVLEGARLAGDNQHSWTCSKLKMDPGFLPVFLEVRNHSSPLLGLDESPWAAASLQTGLTGSGVINEGKRSQQLSSYEKIPSVCVFV